jgi:AraC family transcriptional regulator
VPGVFHDSSTALHDRDEFPIDEIHGIGSLQANRVLLDSRGLGWRDGYTSYTVESPWSATLDAVPHLCLAYCSNREAIVRRDVEGERTERTILRPRHFGSVPAGRSASFDLDGRPDIQHVYLRQVMLDELIVDAFGLDPAAVEVVPELGFNDPLLEQLVVSLLDVVRADHRVATDGLYADHVLRLIGLRVLRQQSSLAGRPAVDIEPPSDATIVRVQAARDFIEASLAGELSLVTIAQHVGLRPHVLTAAFRDQLGVTLHQYVISRRVERARTLLHGSDMPIAQIALEVGFASQSHFTHAFKKVVGDTPASYRRHG